MTSSTSKWFGRVFVISLLVIGAYVYVTVNLDRITHYQVADSVDGNASLCEPRDLLPDRLTYVHPALLPCGWTPDTFLRPTRAQCVLTCANNGSSISFREVPSNATPSITTVSDSCLRQVIREHCTCCEKQKIPKVAHYVRYGAFNLTLDGFISVLSVARFVQPCVILFHADVIPHGPYWRALLHLVPNLVHVQAERPRKIHGKPINVVEHSSDVTRLRLMIDYGGMYLDNDFLVLRSLDSLLNESTVLGYENEGSTICNGFMMAETGAPFFHKWRANYSDFNDGQWAEHSVRRPYLLSRDYSALVKVVKTFHKPPFNLIGRYFDRSIVNFDWSAHYGLHLYTRVVKAKFYRERIDKQDNHIGDIVRHVLHGDRYACLLSS